MFSYFLMGVINGGCILYPANRTKSILNNKRLKCCLILGLISLIIVLGIYYSYLSIHNSHEPLVDQQAIVINNDNHLNSIYFIFLNGLGCVYEDNISKNMSFEKIRSSLTKLGFSFCDERFLLYSYVGGKIIDGKWYPEKYTAKDTGQAIDISVERLEYLFEQFSSAHPEAKFILVGHSLGGRIALDFISTALPQYRQKVKGVITLNSPLMGAGRKVPGIILNILSYSDSIFASPAVKEIIGEFSYQQELASLRRQTIKKLQNDGIRVATFSTYQDYFVDPLTGCLMDEANNPVSEGFIVNLVKLSSMDILGHMGILESPEVVRYIISLCSN